MAGIAWGCSTNPNATNHNNLIQEVSMAIYHDTEYRAFRASLLRPIACISNRFADMDSDDPFTVVCSLAGTIMDLRQSDHDLVNWLIQGYRYCSLDDQTFLRSNERILRLLNRRVETDDGSA